MTYIVFQNGNFWTISYYILKKKFNIHLDTEEMGRISYPIVARQESEKVKIIKNENNSPRDMSPSSQLSQSTARTNTPSVKDIQRDEPMLGF